MEYIDIAVNAFADEVSDILCDFRNYEVEAVFYLTEHCNLACPGCYMQASPNKSKDVLPTMDIEFYLYQLKKLPNFVNTVVFSGGEIFTTPLEYIKRNAQQVLDNGCALQLKTNGSWANNPTQRNQVLSMLRQLRPWYGRMQYEYSINDVFNNVPNWLNKALGRLYWNRLVRVSALDMAISVDNILHPEKSADWFCDIVNAVTEDKELARKINLKSFSFFQAGSHFRDKVINNEKLKMTHFSVHSRIPVCKYRVNGHRVESYLGNYVNVANIDMYEKLSNIVLCPIGNMTGRLVYCFYPDETVGLDCLHLESVGRVPYIDENGEYKSISRITKDIHDKLVADYRAELLKRTKVK